VSEDRCQVFRPGRRPSPGLASTHGRLILDLREEGLLALYSRRAPMAPLSDLVSFRLDRLLEDSFSRLRPANDNCPLAALLAEASPAFREKFEAYLEQHPDDVFWALLLTSIYFLRRDLAAHELEIRYRLRTFNRRPWRSAAIEPIAPAIVLVGRSARYPRRMRD
jgi:hypothetical protein